MGHVALDGTRHRAVPGTVQGDAIAHPVGAGHTVGFEEGDDLSLCHPHTEVAHTTGVETGRPFGDGDFGVVRPHQITGAIASRRGHHDIERLIGLLLEQRAHGAKDRRFVSVPENHRCEDWVLSLCGHDPLSNEVVPRRPGPRNLTQRVSTSRTHPLSLRATGPEPQGSSLEPHATVSAHGSFARLDRHSSQRGQDDARGRRTTSPRLSAEAPNRTLVGDPHQRME